MKMAIVYICVAKYLVGKIIAAVLYAYMNNVYSCRKIEDCLNQHIHYMWLSGSQYPSFSTINRFRSEHLKEGINSLFTQVVLMLVQLVQITLET
jgi:transposase